MKTPMTSAERTRRWRARHATRVRTLQQAWQQAYWAKNRDALNLKARIKYRVEHEQNLLRSRLRKILLGGSGVPVVPYGRLEGEQAVIAEARALRAAGLSLRKVAAVLDGKGMRTRSGHRFAPAQVSRMVAGWITDEDVVILVKRAKGRIA